MPDSEEPDSEEPESEEPGSAEPEVREPDAAGFELPLLLLAGFRTIIDGLHEELARRGHPDVRPAHGFAMQAIGSGGVTASELGRRLGISKQAAGKTVDRLENLGYAERVDDTADARRKRVRLTERGIDSLAKSAAIFEDLRVHWADAIGSKRLRDLEADLRTMAPASQYRLDAAEWFGA